MMDSFYRILCVDNDLESCKAVFSLFRNSGKNYIFNSIPNSDKALNLIEEQAYDLYLIDCLLADEINGVELCRRIRLSDAETPIIFFNSLNDKFTHMEAIKFGANQCFYKPLELGRLEEAVEQLLAEKQIWDEMKVELSFGNDKPARIFSFM